VAPSLSRFFISLVNPFITVVQHNTYMCFQARTWNESNWLHNSDCKILSRMRVPMQRMLTRRSPLEICSAFTCIPSMLVYTCYNNSISKHNMLSHMSRHDSSKMTESKILLNCKTTAIQAATERKCGISAQNVTSETVTVRSGQQLYNPMLDMDPTAAFAHLHGLTD